MRKTCTQCGMEFDFSAEDAALLAKFAVQAGEHKFEIPPPTLCFSCRLQRRLSFYNSRTLYRRTCDFTGAQIVSIFSPDKPFKVYDKKVWFSDVWDPLSYGRPIDFDQPFLPQVQALLASIPLKSLEHFGMDNVNGEFTNDNYKVKDCYLVFDGEQAEDCLYGHSYVMLRSCVDFLFMDRSELCYECSYCDKCYGLRHSRFCNNCTESWFLRDCIGCKQCFGCANLRQKQYCIFNQQKTKAEYEEFVRNFRTDSFTTVESLRERAETFISTMPVKATRGEQNVEVSGDNVSNSKNSAHCFDCLFQEDCRYCSGCKMSSKDCMDVHVWGDGLELSYDCCVVGAQSRNLAFNSAVSQGCSDVYYSLYCSLSCSKLFGCVGLRRKQHCILNTQYSKQEYERLLARLIEHMRSTGEWGEFFPVTMSPFGYNETMAQAFFPLRREEVLERNWQWCDYEASIEAKRTVSASQLPDCTADIPDEVLDFALLCVETKKPFKITKRELEFYRTHRLPLPRYHPDERHRRRMLRRNPLRLWQRQCSRCMNDIQTSYAPDRPEIVYCEQCYLKEVY